MSTKKILNLIWNDLPLRLSTHLIALFAFLYLILLVYLMFLGKNNNPIESGLSVYFLIFGHLVIPYLGYFFAMCALLFLAECKFKKLRLNFLFFKLSFCKIIVLFFYSIVTITLIIFICSRLLDYLFNLFFG